MAGNGDTGQCVSRGGGGSPPIFRLADIGSSIVFGATTAINLNGIHDVLERSDYGDGASGRGKGYRQ